MATISQPGVHFYTYHQLLKRSRDCTQFRLFFLDDAFIFANRPNTYKKRFSFFC